MFLGPLFIFNLYLLVQLFAASKKNPLKFDSIKFFGFYWVKYLLFCSIFYNFSRIFIIPSSWMVPSLHEMVSLKLADQFAYFGSKIPLTEISVNI